jgi:hypothetical protein
MQAAQLQAVLLSAILVDGLRLAGEDLLLGCRSDTMLTAFHVWPHTAH